MTTKIQLSQLAATGLRALTAASASTRQQHETAQEQLQSAVGECVAANGFDLEKLPADAVSVDVREGTITVTLPDPPPPVAAPPQEPSA